MSLLDSSSFNLDVSGVVGFFGGEEAISAMGTVHVYEGRKYLGWYNSPGSFVVAKQYGRLAKSRLWNGLFPGNRTEPTELFEYDGERGPEFIAAHSGTRIKDTGHTGHLFLKECQSLPERKVEGRLTLPTPVTIVRLGPAPDERIYPTLQRKWSSLIAAVPIIISLGGCVACGIDGDWYLFSMILLGIISNGLSCLAIGNAQLEFFHPKPANGSVLGDGFLHAGSEIVILLGEEGSVNAITRGKFSLKFPHKSEESGHQPIGLAATLLLAQFLLQLLLIPQGTLYGQIWFLGTSTVSWMYNCYLSSIDKELVQREILVKRVLCPKRPVLSRYSLGTWTTMTVFVLLVLQPAESARRLLDHLLPNETPVWKIWKQEILERLKDGRPLVFEKNDRDDLEEGENNLLKILYGDAEAAYQGFSEFIVTAPYVNPVTEEV